jgi:hypothetical protein
MCALQHLVLLPHFFGSPSRHLCCSCLPTPQAAAAQADLQMCGIMTIPAVNNLNIDFSL